MTKKDKASTTIPTVTEIATAFAKLVDGDGRVTVSVKLRLHSETLIYLGWKAKREKTTIEDLLQEYCDFGQLPGGLLEWSQTDREGK